MALDQATLDRIWLAFIRATGGEPRPCPICGTSAWVLNDGVSYLGTYDDFLRLGSATRYQPLIPLICSTCGNTVLINIRVIGLADLAEELAGRPTASTVRDG